MLGRRNQRRSKILSGRTEGCVCSMRRIGCQIYVHENDSRAGACDNSPCGSPSRTRGPAAVQRGPSLVERLTRKRDSLHRSTVSLTNGLQRFITTARDGGAYDGWLGSNLQDIARSPPSPRRRARQGEVLMPNSQGRCPLRRLPVTHRRRCWAEREVSSRPVACDKKEPSRARQLRPRDRHEMGLQTTTCRRAPAGFASGPTTL